MFCTNNSEFVDEIFVYTSKLIAYFINGTLI